MANFWFSELIYGVYHFYMTIGRSAFFSWACFMWPHIAGLIFGGCWIAAIVWMLIELWARINQ